MFEVKGVPILADEMEVLQQLKEQVFLQQGREIFRKMKRGPKNIMVCCPIHNNGQERRPSCGISTEGTTKTPPGMVHCFSCGYTATLDKMISDIYGMNDDGAYGSDWLLQNFLSYDIEKRKINLEFARDTNPQKNYIQEEELQKYRFYHPYMYKRKLTNDIIDLFDVGYDKTDQCITFPVKDIDGNCLFITKRSVLNKQFYIPDGVQKPVYGLYEISKITDLKELYVCESQINALTCWVYGKPAVALLGTGNEYQYKQLRNVNCRKLVLALDPDKAGNKGTYKIIKNVRNKIIVKLQIPQEKDINDLSYLEFCNLNQLEIF